MTRLSGMRALCPRSRAPGRRPRCFVMAGLVPAIHAGTHDRDEPGHDVRIGRVGA